MKNPLPKIDGAELLRLNRSGVTNEADAIRKQLMRCAGSVTPATIVALALARFPDQSANAAVASLQADVSELTAALEASSVDLRRAIDSERERLAPMVGASAHRVLEIVGLVAHIDSSVISIQSRNESQRERLRKAGFTGAELEAGSVPTDYSGLLVERDALLAEQDRLNIFLASRDSADYPGANTAKVRSEAA